MKAKGNTQWILPNKTNIETGTCAQLSRCIYMWYVLDISLSDTSYGLNADGVGRTQKLGYLPPPVNERAAILARIGQDPPLTPARTNIPVHTAQSTVQRTNYPTSLPTIPHYGLLSQSLLFLLQIGFLWRHWSLPGILSFGWIGNRRFFIYKRPFKSWFLSFLIVMWKTYRIAGRKVSV